jgi:hypothetical protein
MRRIILALLVLATGCTSTVVLGTLATDGGITDLSDTLCSGCDLSSTPTDISPQPDLGDAFLPFDAFDGVNDLSH